MKHTSKFFRRLSLLLLIFALLFGSFGCDNAADVSNIDVSSDTGSVTFDIVWEKANEGAENGVTRAISDVCGTNWNEVSWVKAGIYNGDTQIAISQEWSCSAGSGSISGVTPGTGYSLFVVGLNSDRLTVYSGEVLINVYAGQTTNAGAIVAIQSYVTKKSPSFSGAMGIDPYGHTFEWHPALGISAYCFQIRNLPWDDPGAITVVHEHPVEGTTFTITPDHGLNPDTTYYWGVFPLDFDDNGGYDNTWSFTTGTSVSEDNYEENDSLATAWDNDGDPATWESSWLSDIDGSGTAVFGDDDWYQIEVDATGFERVMIECRFEHDKGDVDVYLYDQSGTLLEFASSSTDNEYMDVYVGSIGLYYIKVTKYSAGINTYDLYWNDIIVDDEPGVYTLDYDWGCNGMDGTVTAVLYSNNRFVTKSGGGSWNLSGDLLSIIYGNGTIYTTNSIGFYPIEGDMIDFNGNTGCWTAYLYENP